MQKDGSPPIDRRVCPAGCRIYWHGNCIELLQLPAKRQKKMDSNSHNILVVDDEPDVRSLVEQAINRVGYNVFPAGCGNQALEVLGHTDISLVITDVRMPQMSGMELLACIKKTTPHMPVIILTGYASVQNAVEAMRSGAADYVMKPFTIAALQSAVQRVLRRHQTDDGVAGAGSPAAGGNGSRKIVTRNKKFMALLDTAVRVAASNATVLIQGESGTGKELLARFLHSNSPAAEQPYVAVNCAALPDMLAESELFGHEKGAFTGAVSRKKGKFELARQGTLVLDEISEMSLPLQAKLLRVLQEKEVDRVGGTRPVDIDTRVIAISNVDLKEAVNAGKFRKDLFYRINVVSLTVPPLRERTDDILILTRHICEKCCLANGRKPVELSDAAMKQLMAYRWPGNVRELENALERALLIGSSDRIEPEDLALETEQGITDSMSAQLIRAGQSVREVEKKLIVTTLKQVNDNRAQAAEMLGISIRTLRNKLKEYRQAAEPIAAK